MCESVGTPCAEEQFLTDLPVYELFWVQPLWCYSSTVALSGVDFWYSADQNRELGFGGVFYPRKLAVYHDLWKRVRAVLWPVPDGSSSGPVNIFFCPTPRGVTQVPLCCEVSTFRILLTKSMDYHPHKLGVAALWLARAATAYQFFYVWAMTAAFALLVKCK